MASLKQKIVRFFYPLIRKIGKVGKNGIVLSNLNHAAPKEPFPIESLVLNNGKHLASTLVAGKKIMIVNTASDCGYTGQYEELQALYEQHNKKLMIIAVPSNDFGQQEKGSNEQISQFCQVNYGVSFPLTSKSVVIKNENQHPIFKWLSNAQVNGWNDHAPDWNFSKYLINEHGVLTNYFGPSISPVDKLIINAIDQ